MKPSVICKLLMSLVALMLPFVPLSAGAQSKPERVTIRYGYLPVPVVPLFAAMAHDLLDKENIDLQLIKFTSGPAAFQALQSGSIDAAQGAMAAYYMATTRGLQVRWVYNYGDYSPIEGLVVSKAAKVGEFKDLKGKKVTYPNGSMQNLSHLIALRNAGMALNDIETVPLQPPQGVAAVINGDVDGGWFFDPFVSQAVDKGAALIAVNKKIGAYDPFGFAMTTKFLSEKKNVEAVGRLLRAMAEGQKRFAANPEPTLEKIKSLTGVDRPLATLLIKGLDWYSLDDQLKQGFTMSLANPADHTTGAAAYLKDKVEEPALWGKMITARGNITEYLDNRPLQSALGK